MHAALITKRVPAALVVALVLVVQSFLSAWATGAMPATPRLDAFGNPLCVTSDDHAGGSSDHSTLPACCTLACSSIAPLLPVPDADAFTASPSLKSAKLVPAHHGLIHFLASEYPPGHPRAPPGTV